VLQDAQQGAPAVEELERGRVEFAPPPSREEHRDAGAPPPKKPPGDEWRDFPRFRGGGNGLPRWQRMVIMGVMLFVSALVGWLIGASAAVFARGLEAGRHG